MSENLPSPSGKEILQTKFTRLKMLEDQRDKLNADILRIQDKLEKIRDLPPWVQEEAQQNYYRETGEYVTIDEMRDTMFAQLRLLRRKLIATKKDIKAFLKKETDLLAK